MNTIINN